MTPDTERARLRATIKALRVWVRRYTVAKLRTDGMSETEIAAKTGLSSQQVHQHLLECGGDPYWNFSESRARRYYRTRLERELQRAGYGDRPGPFEGG